MTSLAAQTVFATPLDRRLPRIRLRTRQAPSLLSQKILVTIDRWDIHSRYPEGHFVRSLGEVESKGAEQESLLLEYEVPYRPFGKAILDCLPKEGDTWTVPPKDNDPRGDWRDREDLRDLTICSIDPPSQPSPSFLALCHDLGTDSSFARSQSARTSTTLCTRGRWPTATSKSAFVSSRLPFTLDRLDFDS